MNNSNESSQSSDSLLRDSVVDNNSNIIEEGNSNNSNYVESVLNIERVESTGEYSSNNITFTAQNMIDGDFGTWWTPDPSNGSQSAATFFFENSKKCNVGALKIINGSYGKYYFDNSRITQIKVSFENGESEIADLTDLQDYQRIKFVNKHLTSFVKIEPISRTTGIRWDDICISEIRFLGSQSPDVSNMEGSIKSTVICNDLNIRQIIIEMFDDLHLGTIDAYKYFQSNVKQYITMKNTNPSEINKIFNGKRDYVYIKNSIIDNTFFVVQNNQNCDVSLKSEMICFRPSKNKWQKCTSDVNIKFTNNKISSYIESNIENLIFSEQEF